MIKLVFVLFNLLGVIAYNFVDDKVTVAQEFPKEISQGESFVVSLRIEKGQYDGYAKWQQELPKGFKAEMMETKGGTFSFKDNILKLIWLELPKEDSYTITYRVVTESWVPRKSYALAGRYSYIHDNERKDIFITQDNISVTEPNGNLIELDIDDSIKHETPKGEVNESLGYIDFDKAGKSPANSGMLETKKQHNKTSSLFSQQKITYKIQIAAGHNSVEKIHFSEVFKIAEPIYTEQHNGWKKYTVGNYSNYSSARNKRNRIWASHKQSQDAFITAYISGKRISVQEALKISEEQWIK